MPATQAMIKSLTELSPGQKAEMFELFADHFEGVSRELFERDLSEKNRVILIHRDCKLVGFSTLLAYETRFKNEAVSVIYSGDTIVAPNAWGTTALPRTWISCVRSLRGIYPHGKLYWLLLTSGFRTYRFLPLFWKEYFPRHSAPFPNEAKLLRDHLSKERFGNRYDPKMGIVRFERPQRLRQGLSGTPPGRTVDPDISFFLKANPGHVSGDELVCLTELSDENLTSAGRRMIRE